MILALIMTACLFGRPVIDNDPPPPSEESQHMWSNLQLTKLDGTPLDKATIAGKATLFVNVASRCGFTKQYTALQALYEEFGSENFTIIGVPCNQFGRQEPGKPEEIATFCKANYGVTFPLLQKQEVKGAGRSPLYQYLVSSPVGADKDIKWNFEKFVVDPSGTVVARFPSNIKPDNEALRSIIQRLTSK